MSIRFTTRSIPATSDEFAPMKSEVKSDLHDDFFLKGRWHDERVTLVETMDSGRCVGFTIQLRLGSRNTHGYSFVTHNATYNRSEAQAIKWVKDQAKKEQS